MATTRSSLSQNLLEGATATIANNATTSDAISGGGAYLCAVSFPAAFTGTQISYEVSFDGSTYRTLRDSTGAVVATPCHASDTVAVDLATFGPFPYIKIVSDATELAQRLVLLHFAQ